MNHKRKKRLAKAMQFITSTISTAMVLVLLGLVMLLSLTARVVADSVKENLTVTVVLEDDAPTAEAKQLEEELNGRYYVSRVNYISPEQALEEQIESMGVDPTDFLGANPFSISMELNVKPEYSCSDSLQWISQELRETRLVSEVLYQKDLVESLNRNLHRASCFLLSIALLLVIISLSIIHNTVRLSIYGHRFVLQTMKLVGAEWSFIRRPFLVRSIRIGVMAAVLADGALWAAVRWAAAYDEAVLRYVTRHNLLLTSAALLVVGLLLTTICTYISVTRSLHRQKTDLD